jgi:nitroreductase
LDAIVDNRAVPAHLKGRIHLEIYEALYTTRAMRRLKPDPIPLEVQVKLLDAAIRAPSGGNSQRWRFLLVDDPHLRNTLGPLYRACVAQLWATVYADRLATAHANLNTAESIDTLRMHRSAQHLADHFEETPLLLFAYARSDPSGGSIFPAVWSAMLAARAEGIGSCLTTILGFREEEVDALLGVPRDDGWRMACCVTLGYPSGNWGVAARRPLHEVVFRNGWDGPLGVEVVEPLWPGSTG